MWPFCFQVLEPVISDSDNSAIDFLQLWPLFNLKYILLCDIYLNDFKLLGFAQSIRVEQPINLFICQFVKTILSIGSEVLWAALVVLTVTAVLTFQPLLRKKLFQFYSVDSSKQLCNSHAFKSIHFPLFSCQCYSVSFVKS